MKNTVWLILAALVILHHDFWFWSDSTLLGDWMPIGLAYHIILSFVAAGFWLFVVRTAWPESPAANDPGSSDASVDASAEANQS